MNNALPKRARPPQELDRLLRVHFVPPNSIHLTFSDKTFILPIEQLEMPVDRFDWTSIAASPAGERMTVTGIKGDVIPIESSVLRYLVDAEYAAMMDARLAQLQLSEEELERIARDNPPPSEWFAQPSPDLTRESWK